MKNVVFLIVSMAFFSCDPSIDCSTCSTSIKGYEIVVNETEVNDVNLKQLKTECPEGKRVLSSGWSALDETSAIMEGQATYSEPSWDGKHWMVNVKLTSTYNLNWKLRMRCVCADIEE